MKQSTKIILGILTFLPFVLLIIFFMKYFSFIFDMIQHADELENANHHDVASEIVPQIFGYISIIILIALVSLGIKIYYIVHAIKNPKFDSNHQIVWVLLLIFVSGLSSIVYYFMEIIPLKESNKPKPITDYNN